MEVSYSTATAIVENCLRSKLVSMMWGSPAIGKSSIIHQIAKSFNMKMIDVRLAQCDPVDLAGFPVFADGKARYVPMDTFPIEGDAVPPGSNGWIIFLDELTSAPRAVQAAAYKLVLDRMVGNHKLHSKALIVAAGNKLDDGAIVEEMSTALKSRMVHLELVTNVIEWLNWAYQNKIDFRVTDYLKFRPENLYTFKSDSPDHTYASPRTWEFVNKLINGKDVSDTKFYLPLLAGTISEGVAREFLAFCQIYGDPELPKQYQIETQPLLAPIPNRPDVLYALTGLIGTYTNAQNITNIMTYLERLPLEYQVVTVREMYQKNHAMFSIRPVQAWVSKNPEIFQ